MRKKTQIQLLYLVRSCRNLIKRGRTLGTKQENVSKRGKTTKVDYFREGQRVNCPHYFTVPDLAASDKATANTKKQKI